MGLACRKTNIPSSK